MRHAAGLNLEEFGVPIDVLWFRISRLPGDPEQVLGNINYGRALILINRGKYFQAGLIIRKGSFDEIQRDGLPAFRQTIAKIAPYIADRVQEVQSWDQVKLLTVQINRLRNWYLPGLLCIGDAAHAMSPAGGVGINLAIQDAVAAANLLAVPLREGRVTETLLRNDPTTPRVPGSHHAKGAGPRTQRIRQTVQKQRAGAGAVAVAAGSAHPRTPAVGRILGWCRGAAGTRRRSGPASAPWLVTKNRGCQRRRVAWGRGGGPPRVAPLNLRPRIFLPHPLDEFLRCNHRR